MFSIICKRDFKAIHSVRMPNGCFEDPHEHNWKIECKISSETLNNDGFVTDFTIIDANLDKITSNLIDSDLNQVFDQLVPSAENIAFYIYSKLKPLIDSKDIKLKKVKVWEDENHGASYKA